MQVDYGILGSLSAVRRARRSGWRRPCRPRTWMSRTRTGSSGSSRCSTSSSRRSRNARGVAERVVPDQHVVDVPVAASTTERSEEAARSRRSSNRSIVPRLVCALVELDPDPRQPGYRSTWPAPSCGSALIRRCQIPAPCRQNGRRVAARRPACGPLELVYTGGRLRAGAADEPEGSRGPPTGRAKEYTGRLVPDPHPLAAGVETETSDLA